MQYSASFLDWSNMKYVSPIISWKINMGGLHYQKVYNLVLENKNKSKFAFEKKKIYLNEWEYERGLGFKGFPLSND